MRWLFSDLRPLDDLESLTYTLLFLLLGNLPWKHEHDGINGVPYKHEPLKHAMHRIAAAKRELGNKLELGDFPSLPAEFGDLLRLASHRASTFEFTGTTDYARSLAVSRQALDDLGTKLGARQGASLDWTPVPASVTVELPDLELSEAEIALHSDSTANDERSSRIAEPKEEYSNSYWEPDLDCWDIQ
jgi:hypothetical protein